MKRLATLLVIALCACGQKPDQAEVDSWAATLAFAGESYADNRVPKRFVRTCADAADKALEKQPDAAHIRKLALELKDAADRGDRRKALQLAAELKK